MAYIVDLYEGVYGALRSPPIHGVLDILQEVWHDW
jgi:hypothetical protein